MSGVYLTDSVLDAGLEVIQALSGTADLYICSALPTTYAEATSTYKVGTKANVTIDAQADHTSGRKITIQAITGGTVDATGTASHWGLTDGTSALLCAQDLSATQAVTSGNTFSLGAIIIAIPDAAD